MISKSKVVYLVRHGENEIIFGDPKLTPKGESQAHVIQFDVPKIDGIISSPTKRTLETAKIIHRRLNIPYQTNDLLKERIDFLDVPKIGYTNFRKLCMRSSIERDFALPNGESSFTSGLRLEYYMTVVANMIDNAVVMVTHQGIISDYLRNKFSEAIIEAASETFTKIREDAIANCSITRVDVVGSMHTLRYIGRLNNLV